MKDIIRHATGVFFLFFFLLFLFLSALQFEVLTPRFWTKSLATSGVYQELVKNVDVMQGKLDTSMGRNALQLKGVVTQERLQQAIEENISRFLAFIQGKSKEFLLFLPLREWGLPELLLSQPPLNSLSRDTKLADALLVLGIKPDGVQQVVKGLGTVQQIVQLLPVAWFVLLVIVIGLGAVYYALGVGKARFNHIGFLFIVAGLVAGLIGTSGSVLGATVMRGTSGWPVWARELGASLVTQFFSLGKFIGFAVAGVGIVLLIVAKKFFQEEKQKGKVSHESMKVRIAKFIAGVVLGSIIIILSFLGLVVSLGGKFDFTLGTTSGGKGTVQTGGRYTSKFGWFIVPPAGWSLQEDPKFVQFTKKSSSASDPWAYVQVRPVERFPSVDQGTYVAMAKDGLLNGKAGFANVVFVEEPKEDVWQGWKRIVLYFEHDDTKLGRMRQLRWQLYPKTSGNGWTLLAVANTKGWDTYKIAIMNALNSFEIK